MVTRNVLFLCTGNSARSILAEAILNGQGQSRFRAFSAGSHPKGEVHPAALAMLEKMGLRSTGYRSKSWDEFAGSGAPPINFVITVCDNAAGEICPVRPGKPVEAHWSIPDPAEVQGPDQAQAFQDAYDALHKRICAFVVAETANG